MDNKEIIELIEERKVKLKKIWYKVQDENFEELVNWFISIANSMMTENMNKIPNMEVSKSFHQNADFYERVNFDISRCYNNMIKNNIKDLNSKKFNPLWYEFENPNDTNEEAEIKETNNNYKFLLSQLDKHYLRDFWWHIESVKEKILWNKDIIESFNKWDLTKLEEEMLIILKKDKYKKKKSNDWINKFVNKTYKVIKKIPIYSEDSKKLIADYTKEISIFKEIIYFQLKNLWEIKENAWKLLKTKLKRLKTEKDKYYKLYVEEDDDDFKLEHKKKYKQTKDEIEGIENQLNNMPAIVKDKEYYIKDYIYYINELWTNFRTFPKARRSKMLKSFFEYIILDKISSTKFNVVDFKLNPIFELAYNKKKVLCNVKNWNNSNNTTSNFWEWLI